MGQIFKVVLYLFQIPDMFENGKPYIVLKTVKRFNTIGTPIIIFI